MITIFPMPSGIELDRAVQTLGGAPQAVLEARDGDERLGLIGFSILGDSVHIDALKAYVPFIADGLIKSVMSYAAQRELPWCTAEDGLDAQSFLSIGFVREDGLLRLQLDTHTGMCNF